MSRTYTVQFDNVSVAAIQDLFELTPADDKPIEIIGLFIAQTGLADMGDAQDESLTFQIVRGYTTSGSAGSAPTPASIEPNDAAAGFTAEANNTTVATAGTPIVLHTDGFSVRTGYQNWWPDGACPKANQGNTTLLVRLTRAPADAILFSGTVYVRES